MKSKIYVLECLTNLHVGNGDVNFNIVDNEVEKDVITGFPTINSSGVKGALRAFFNENIKEDKLIREIFGSEENGEAPGQLKFLSANLLAQAVANCQGGEKPYKLVSPKTAGENFETIVANFANGNGISLQQIEKKYEIEEISDSKFSNFDLPVIARNQLDNGISQNLWYEEVVPYKSIFYITVVSMTDSDLLDKFHDKVNEQVVQFGANASIGYGLCKLVGLN